MASLLALNVSDRYLSMLTEPQSLLSALFPASLHLLGQLKCITCVLNTQAQMWRESMHAAGFLAVNQEHSGIISTSSVVPGRMLTRQSYVLAEVKLKIGPQSVLWRTKPQWVLFFQVQQSSNGWYEMQDIVTIDSEWLPEVAPHMYQNKRQLTSK